MTVGLHGKKFEDFGQEVAAKVISILLEHQVTILVSPKFHEVLSKVGMGSDFGIYDVNSDRRVNLFFSLGGDGTLLETVNHVGKLERPLLGINTGRMGYLATTSRENLVGAVSAVLNDQHVIDERILLRLESDSTTFEGRAFALNDCTILKRDTSSMISINAYVDGEFLTRYWADGLIVSTPTGSTGYSLSCGGPIVMPGSGNFTITPVAPHNLTIRPLVVADTSTITLEVLGRSKKVLVSLDYRNEIVRRGSKLTIKREKFKAKLVKLPGYSNYQTLNQKLNWGVDIRNWTAGA